MGRHRHGFEGAVRSRGLCPCKRRAKEIARLHPNPKGKRLALQYLETTHLPLFEIAVLLGFSDPSNFRRAFRKWTGTAPTDYRARPVTPEENDR